MPLTGLNNMGDRHGTSPTDQRRWNRPRAPEVPSRPVGAGRTQASGNDQAFYWFNDDDAVNALTAVIFEIELRNLQGSSGREPLRSLDRLGLGHLKGSGSIAA